MGLKIMIIGITRIILINYKSKNYGKNKNKKFWIKRKIYQF